MEAGMAKLFASETAMEIALNAVRIHGGYGYSTEFDVERYFRDAPLMIVGEGTNEIQRNVIARQLSVDPAPALGRQDADRRVQTARHVPGRQHVVDRRREFGRPGQPGEAERGVDRVVDGRRAVPVPGDHDLDQVRPVPPQGLVLEKAPAHRVGEQDPPVRAWGGDQPGDELLAARRAEIDRDRALALVQARPVQAGAIGRARPPGLVGGAADRVDADHVGTELSQRHPAQRRGDEA
jgi:hypothetical protein